MIRVDSCMIWFHFDGVMQLKKSYYIATNVCNKKSATPFGDLADCYLYTTVSQGNTQFSHVSNIREFHNLHGTWMSPIRRQAII